MAVWAPACEGVELHEEGDGVQFPWGGERWGFGVKADSLSKADFNRFQRTAMEQGGAST